jgi:hypothetical protein
MLTNVTINGGDQWELKINKLSEMISYECYVRIYDIEINTAQIITVVRCKNDLVEFPLVPSGYLHKEEVGFITVVTDIISTMIIYYMFNKLNSINDEYLEILDNNVIKMKDFSIQIKRLKVTSTTQDTRILKLKLWLHFSKVLEKFKDKLTSNQLEIADIQFSLTKRERHFALYKMQEYHTEKNEIHANIEAGSYIPTILWQRTKDLEKLNEKFKKQ